MDRLSKVDSPLKGYVLGICMIVVPWLVVFFFRIAGPISFSPLSDGLYLFVSLYLCVSIMSYSFFFFCKKKRTVKRPIDSDCVVFSRVYFLIILLAFLYPLITVYDFFILKGGHITEIVAMRELEHLTGPRNSLIGATRALLSGAAPIAFTMALQSYDTPRIYKNIIFFVSVIGLFSTFLSGGRNAFFIGLLYIFMHYIYHIGPVRVKSKTSLFRVSFEKITFYLFVCFGFIYSMKIFVDRFSLRGMGAQDMLEHLSTDYDVSISFVDTSNLFLSAAYSAYVYLVFYVTHALSYLDQYFVNGVDPLFCGAYNFPILSRVFDIIFSSNTFANVREEMILPGVYLSLPGSLYLDFSVVGALLSGIIFSGVFGYYNRNIRLLKLYQQVICSFIAVMFVFSPVYSVLGMANGFSILFLICVISIMSLPSIIKI